MKEMLINAKNAKQDIASLSTDKKNELLLSMADSLINNSDKILKANEQDIKNATGKINDVMIDRLRLTSERIEAMANGIRDVSKLKDPVGRIFDTFTREDGLKIEKMSVPFGVVAIIYESRPNVTSDAAALCIKSGNVCVLRGGKEAFNSANAIVDALKSGIKGLGVNENIINLVTDTKRESATALMTANGYVDFNIICIKNAKSIIFIWLII